LHIPYENDSLIYVQIHVYQLIVWQKLICDTSQFSFIFVIDILRHQTRTPC